MTSQAASCLWIGKLEARKDTSEAAGFQLFKDFDPAGTSSIIATMQQALEWLKALDGLPDCCSEVDTLLVRFPRELSAARGSSGKQTGGGIVSWIHHELLQVSA